MNFKLLAEGPGYQFAHVGSLFLTTHTLAAGMRLADELDDVMDQHRRAYPRFSVLAMVSGTGITSPEAGMKDRVIAQEKRFENAINGAAVVIEAKGLPAVLTRGFLVAYTLMSSHKFPLQSFGSIESGVSWLKSLQGQDPALVTDAAVVAEAQKLLERVAPTPKAA